MVMVAWVDAFVISFSSGRDASVLDHKRAKDKGKNRTLRDENMLLRITFKRCKSASENHIQERRCAAENHIQERRCAAENQLLLWLGSQKFCYRIGLARGGNQVRWIVLVSSLRCVYMG